MPRPLAALVLVTLFLHAHAEATTLSWKTAVSGSAVSGSNWNPAQVPTSTDDLVFNLAGAYTVTWNGVADSHTQAYRQGTVGWTSNGAHTIGSTFKVAELAGENATLLIQAGTITAAAGFTIGSASGSTGSINLTGPTALITAPNTSDIIVGSGGTGSLNLTNGGRVSVANFSQFGSGASGTGNLLVSGVSASAVRSRFSSGFPAPGTVTFAGAGHSTTTIDNGGLFEATNRVSIAPGVGAVGSVLVQNASGATASEFNVTGALDIAFALGAAAAGTGSLDLTNGSKATISGLTTVGDANGGTGTLHVRNNCRFTGGGLVFDDAHGVLDWTGGTITVKNGLFDPPGTTLDIAAGTRYLVLDSLASATFTSSPLNAYALIVGESGKANFDVLRGSDLLTNATTALGVAPGSNGGMHLQGAGTTWTPAAGGASQLVVGIAGVGSLSVDQGAEVTADVLNAAYSAGSTGTIFVTGAGSRLAGTSIVFGGHGTTVGGASNVTVASGGALVSNGDAVGIAVLAPANLFVNSGATVEVPFGELHNSGDITLGGGSIDAVIFALEGAGTLGGNGAVHGLFSAPDSTTFLGPFGGVMELGDSTVSGAFFMNGTFKVGSADVRVRSRTSSSLPHCSIEGGTLDLRPGGGSVPSARTLSGRGTIRGHLSNMGTITAVTTGLTIADTLASSGKVLNGSKFTFAPGSRFQGFGSIDADAVDAQAGSTLAPLGALTIGKNAATTSVTLAGRLFVSSGGTVTVNHLVSTAPCSLGTLTHINGSGHLNRTNGFVLGPGDSLEGAGTIQGPVSNYGVVSPGTEPATNTRFATLSVSGNFTLNGNARVVVQIGDAPTNQFDKLAITGVATLGGTLDVRLPEGFAPAPGEQFTVMTFASRVGMPTVTFQGYPVGAALVVGTTPTSIFVTAGNIPVGVPEEPLPAVLAFAGTSGARGSAAFTVALPDKAHVRIAVYGPTGRRVAMLCDGELPAGTTRFPLAASGLNSGVWFARAEITTPHGRETRTARAILLR